MLYCIITYRNFPAALGMVTSQNLIQKVVSILNEKRENKMGVMPIGKLLFSMSFPAMFSMFIQAMYNIVDSIFVARLGEHALTAISLAFPIQTLMIAVSVGTGVGLNSLISRKLGEHNFKEADNAASHGVMLMALSYLVFCIFGLFFSHPFISSFTNDAEIIALGSSYTFVVTVFSFGSFLQIGNEKILQATGNMVYPMLFQLIGAITNIILDPIFIFGMFGVPAMGVFGAAVATVTGQILAMAFSMYIVFFRKHEVHITIRGFRFQWDMIKKIYAVGLPSIVMQSITSILTIGLNNILMAFSSAAVSVLGVYFKLQSFVFMPVFGLGQGAMPIMGYNFGARNSKRLMHTLKLSIGVAIGIMAVGTLIFWGFTEQLLMMFNASEEMLVIGVPALRIISSSFIFSAVGISNSNFFQAVGEGKKSLFVSVLRQLVIILPLSWFFARFFSLEAVWYAFPISECFALVCSLLFLRNSYNTKVVPILVEGAGN